LATHLAASVTKDNAWAENMILLGDFNIFQKEDTTYQALVDGGFQIPPNW